VGFNRAIAQQAVWHNATVIPQNALALRMNGSEAAAASSRLPVVCKDEKTQLSK